MIKAVHTLIYSDDPGATRAFLRDVLRWPSVEDPDSEPDWPIFKTGPSEMGVHPTSGTWEGQPYSQPKHHSISLMCDDIEATKAELEGRGAEFTSGVEDFGFGLGAMLKLPGADDILLYQPSHPEAHSLTSVSGLSGMERGIAEGWITQRRGGPPRDPLHRQRYRPSRPTADLLAEDRDE